MTNRTISHRMAAGASRLVATVGLVAALPACEDAARTDYLHAAAALRDPVANLAEVADAVEAFDKLPPDNARLDAQMAVGVACEQALPKIRTLNIKTTKLRDSHVMAGLSNISAAVRGLEEEMKGCDRSPAGNGGAPPQGTLMCAKFCIQSWPAVATAVNAFADEAKKKEVNAPRLGKK